MARPVVADHGGEDAYRDHPEQPAPSQPDYDAQFAGLVGDLEAVSEITIAPPQWPEEPARGPTSDIQDLFSSNVRVMEEIASPGRQRAVPSKTPRRRRRPAAVKSLDITPALQAGLMTPEEAEAKGFEVPEGFEGPEALPDFQDMIAQLESLAQTGQQGRFTLRGGKAVSSHGGPKTDFSKQSFPEGDPQDNQADAEAAALSATRLHLDRKLRWIQEVTELLHEHTMRIDDLTRQLERDRD